MKRNYLKVVILLSLIFFVSNFKGSFAQDKSENTSNKTIYFFYGQGCPHCEHVDKYFIDNNIYSRYPIEKKEIYGSRENALLLTSMLQDRNYATEKIGVPLVIIGEKVLVGDQPIINNFEVYVDKYLENNDFSLESKEKPDVNPVSKNLTVFAVAGAALVDAINPCAFAVLIILMTTILAKGSSRKALYSGLAFSVAIFISYLLMGLGVYKALSYGDFGKTLFNIIATLAIVLGLLNIKDFIWYGKGILIEVPLSWRPKLKTIINGVTNPIGAFLTGFIISLFLLPCTSGPYIVILGLLGNTSTQTEALPYLILYNVIFVLPMVLITVAVYKGMDTNKLEALRKKNLKLLHLVAGVILILLGIVMLASF